jgi:hypothetical protein
VLAGSIESDYAIELFERLGIARSRIVAERQSRNTIENAEFSKEPDPAQTRRALTASGRPWGRGFSTA